MEILSLKKIGQGGGACRWRVCYQGGLPRLVCKNTPERRKFYYSFFLMIIIFFVNLVTLKTTSTSLFVMVKYIYSFLFPSSHLI